MTDDNGSMTGVTLLFVTEWTKRRTVFTFMEWVCTLPGNEIKGCCADFCSEPS